jgi:hypothetical protein
MVLSPFNKQRVADFFISNGCKIPVIRADMNSVKRCQSVSTRHGRRRNGATEITSNQESAEHLKKRRMSNAMFFINPRMLVVVRCGEIVAVA